MARVRLAPMPALARYVRLYLSFLRFGFSQAMQFRLDYFFRVVMDINFYIVNIAFFSIIYNHTSMMGNWNLDQTYIFIAAFFVIDAIHMTVFANNMWWFPMLVNKGDLDYYIVRPVSSLFFLSLRDFAANSFLNLLIALGILAWAIVQYPEPLGAARIVVFLVLLALGSLIYYMLHMLFLIPVFWFHSGRGLGELFYQLERYAARPHQIFQGWLRRLLVTALPFALVASFPAHALFDGLTLENLARTAIVVLALFSFMVWVWNRGLRAYSSASS